MNEDKLKAEGAIILDPNTVRIGFGSPPPPEKEDKSEAS